MRLAVLRMTKRSRNGPRCRKYHLVPPGRAWSRPALCGTKPNVGAMSSSGAIIGMQGWGTVQGKVATCAPCLAKRDG